MSIAKCNRCGNQPKLIEYWNGSCWFVICDCRIVWKAKTKTGIVEDWNKQNPKEDLNADND
jgi:hypothetical protein